MATDKNAVAGEARELAAKGQFVKAIAAWKKLLAESPNDATIFNAIGDLCLKKNSKAEAVEAYQRAADILARDGFTSKAIALYKKILNIDPKKTEAHLALGGLNAEKGLIGSALESYKIAADHYSGARDATKALDVYQKMADLNPTNVSFRIKLAEMYAKENMKDQATRAFLEAADIFLEKDAFTDARHLFEKVLALDPDNKDVYHKAGLLYFREGKFAEACKALKPAFENDHANRELASAYLEALTQAGMTREAEETLRKLLDEDPGGTELREKLFRVYLADGDAVKALVEATVLVDAEVERGRTDTAEGYLKELVGGNPRFAHGHRKLAEFYASRNRPDEAARELITAADILIEEGDRERADAVLERALELAPDLPEARQRLEHPEAPAAPLPESETEPFREPDLVAPEGAEEIVETEPHIPVEAASAKEDDDSVVAEKIIEAEMLVKYGLIDKAAEQLAALAENFPDHPEILIKLRDICYEQGNIDRAVHYALHAVDLLLGDNAVDLAEETLRTTGIMAPDHPDVLTRLAKIFPAPSPAEGGPVGFETPEAPPSPDEVLEQAAFQEAISQFEEHDAPAASATMSDEASDVSGPESLSSPDEAPMEEMEIPVPDVPETGPATGEPQVQEDLGEIRAEAEFYFFQGLFEEAEKYYLQIITRVPDDKVAMDRLAEIAREKEALPDVTEPAAAVRPEGAAPIVGGPAGMPVNFPDEETIRSPERQAQEVDQAGMFVPRDTEAVDSEGPPRAAEEEDFFDLGEEIQNESPGPDARQEVAAEGFFDLAAELREELSAVTIPEQPSGTSGEQSLDDVFQEFKKGIEQLAEKDEAESHHSIGIAYKEMALLDDAIAEFLKTTESEPKFIRSRHMLALCYLEKGAYEDAITEMQKALSHAGQGEIEEGDSISLYYDLGLAYQGSGDNEKALAVFRSVLESNPDHRDAADKVKALDQGSVISPDEIKEEIEKRVTAQFLAESEKIEREEQTRKNEKVKS